MHDSVKVEVQLDSNPAGVVWVAAKICVQESDEGVAPVAESCVTFSELQNSLGSEAVLVKANHRYIDSAPVSASSAKKLSNDIKIYSASFQPRAWKYTGNLHAKGTRHSKHFVLRVQAWVFSPRGIGVLATQIDSPSFKLSSTQHLRKMKKRESAGNSDAATANIATKRKKIKTGGKVEPSALAVDSRG